ncbi:MAG: ribosomal protein S18-alanine N-acetyltransferase [Deltaproteobacteria bacterium]|nr:ribosomal protein S18-alanine N-acetyltransferase [Deltaproteobacteria bacterium]
MISLVRVTRENSGHYLQGILEIEKASFVTPWSREAFHQELLNPVSHLWVLEEDHLLAGYVCFWIHDAFIEVLHIAVRPDKRRRGYGRRLLEEVISTGTDWGVDQVWLEVRESNRPARELYRKMGFEEVGVRPCYYRDTHEDAVSMTLKLQGKSMSHRKFN